MASTGTTMARAFGVVVLLVGLCACVGEADFPNVDFDNLPDPQPAPNPNPDMPDPNPDMPDPNPDMPDPNPDMPDPNPDMPDPNPDPMGEGFDRQIFIDTVSPPLTPCSLAPTCHAAPNGAFGQDFAIKAQATEDADIDANLTEVEGFISLDAPADSRLLVKGRDNHNGLIFNDDDYCAIFNWIYTALPEDPPTCTPP